MANVKAGDLAIIVRAPDTPENIGAIVEVVEPGRSCVCGCDHGITWRVLSRGRKLSGFNIFNMKLQAERVTVHDDELRPIKGDSDSDAVDEMVRKVGPAPMTLTELMNREVVS